MSVHVKGGVIFFLFVSSKMAPVTGLTNSAHTASLFGLVAALVGPDLITLLSFCSIFRSAPSNAALLGPKLFFCDNCTGK